MSEGLFNGLDDIILNQPDLIDTSSFNKADEKIDDKVDDDTDNKLDNKKDKSDKKDQKTDKKDENFIDPNDFFNRVKEDLEDQHDKNDVDNKDDKSDDDKSNGQVDVINTWADYFKDQSLLNDDDLKEFNGSIESLITAFQERERRVGIEMVEDYKSQLPDELKFLADNWEEGVPLNKLIDIRSNKIKYSQITDEKLKESVDTQKTVYAEYLRKTTKMSETKIEKEISRLVDLEELEEETLDALKELKKLEDEAEDTLRRETKKEQEFRKSENAKTIKAYEKYVNDSKEIVPGLKVDDKVKKDVLNKIINPIGIDGNGYPVSFISNLRNEDPFKFDTAVTYLATITKGFTDWSKIISVGETKAVKSLEDKLNTAAPKSVKDNIKTTGKQSLLELLEKNKGIFGK